jgi:hypothetical protein
MVCLLALSGVFALAPQAVAQEGGAGVSAAVPAGQPLSESEIIILLQAKVPLEVIEKFVSVRGVNFVSSKETSKKILAAGGNVSLIGTVNLNQKDDPSMMAVAANGKEKDKKKK